MAYFGGLHFWWPKMSGKMYPSRGAGSPPASSSSIQPDVLPAFVLGYLGMPRRYIPIGGVPGLQRALIGRGVDPCRRLHLAAALSAVVVALGQGGRAQPVARDGLEWQTESPPPTENFDEVPVVTEEPYAYHRLVAQNGAPLVAGNPPPTPVVT